MKDHILWFNACSYDNKHLVGGKNASLGELNRLSQLLSFNAANGFAVTTLFYSEYLHNNNLGILVDGAYRYESLTELQQKSQTIKDAILGGDFTPEQVELLKKNYSELSFKYNTTDLSVAVRSSAVAEDMPDASFAGQQDTYLNVCGISDLLSAIKQCMASLFNVRSISYRKQRNVPLSEVKISIGIQKMVRSDLGCSGVAFSIDTESGYNRAIIINSSVGLGESVVSGAVSPDEVIVDKRTLNIIDADPIIMKKLGDKTSKVIYADNGQGTISQETTTDERINFSITNNQAIALARVVYNLESKYRDLLSLPCGIDVEWAIDGMDGRIFIIQTRPETTHTSASALKLTKYSMASTAHLVLATGISVGERISTGVVRVVSSIDEEFHAGDILVTDMTTPDWEPLMKIAAGIVTNKGGRTCHAAIIARELGINTIVGTSNATSCLTTGDTVTLCCALGETGKVYAGECEYHATEIELSDTSTLPVNLMFNIGDPGRSFSAAKLPNAGVGLARMEFIISNYIKIHPMALTAYPHLPTELREEIFEMIGNHDNGTWFFIKRLARGISKIAAAFHPKPVIVRLSDFKSNEYRNLIGGELYEPTEENPMIGWRGASRYYSKEYTQAFGLECKAIHYAINVMKMDNIIVMIPFCRTPKECAHVLRVMEGHGLQRSAQLKIYLMCEIPSNVIEADRFAPYIDGVSIGGNDLLQLTLGIDRDSDRVSYLSQHTNVSYRRLISDAIRKYKAFGKKVGFCGQQPSYSIEFAEFLIQEGIDSISITPDSAPNIINTLGRHADTNTSSTTHESI